MSWSTVLEPQNSTNQYVMCMWIYMLLDQQVRGTKLVGLTNQLETHKTHKWWSGRMNTEQT